MFDSMKMKVSPVFIQPEMLQQYNLTSFTYRNQKTGVITTYKIQDEVIPYIKYQDGSKALTIQVSIPKLLYGNNVKSIEQSDIPTFFQRVQERLQLLFGIHIAHEDWRITRLDVCCNFHVGNRTGEYIRQLSKGKMPYKDTRNYNHDETVEFFNKSSRVMLYDKYKQCKRIKEPKEVIEQSKGILRLEIRPSDNDLKKYSKEKRAINLVTESFFTYIIKMTLEGLPYTENVESIDYAWLLDNKEDISMIETYLGYTMFKNLFQENGIRAIYTPSTLANRKSMAKQITIPKKEALKRLEIIDSVQG
ncbi:hypothetical protein P9G84_25380 [Brevibacillus centrosporus]|uniref:phage/plasmid replication domain-containing protein n=1 Tax=Brevibacillus centrosporus TaxID=54910 RepID=UPI000F0A5954|nr:phage/plasmid replication protein [Brevibacillus centrosporus]MEC2132242.1 hypothetical protein [Brevibacillus centrosporus]RNB64531.1 hypothetical protein EDM55_27115 [Brevibacillus centrosporus]GED33258.1 hypothetical protein BCE02nite_43990 [Brevibacillus centrosporus]